MGTAPAVDPHTLLSGLIENNMVSPDPATWTVAVNNGWLQVKLQKQYQIAITPSYAEVSTITLDDGTTTAKRRLSHFFIIHLYHPSRTGVWDLYRNFATLMNTRSLVSEGIDGNTDYRFVKIARSESSKAVQTLDKECGFDNPPKGSELGYRIDLTVEVRWNE